MSDPAEVQGDTQDDIKQALLQRQAEIKARRAAKVPNVQAKAQMSPEDQKKLSESFENMQNQAKILLCDRNSETETFVNESDTKTTDLKQIPSVYIKNCNDCHYIFNRRIVKVLVENCTNCTIEINRSVLTRTAEIWHGTDLKLNVRTSIKTLQVDMVENMEIEFSEWSNFFSVIWNQLENCSLSFGDSKEFNTTTGFQQMLTQYPDSDLKTDQFIIRFVEGELKSERCIRLRNGHLSTEREAIDWEKRNDRKRHAHQQKFMKDAGIHLLPEKNKVKIPANAPCPCGSGRKYKKCCRNKKTVTGLATNQRKITYHD